jgi:hypothetical protein
MVRLPVLRLITFPMETTRGNTECPSHYKSAKSVKFEDSISADARIFALSSFQFWLILAA